MHLAVVHMVIRPPFRHQPWYMPVVMLQASYTATPSLQREFKDARLSKAAVNKMVKEGFTSTKDITQKFLGPEDVNRFGLTFIEQRKLGQLIGKYQGQGANDTTQPPQGIPVPASPPHDNRTLVLHDRAVEAQLHPPPSSPTAHAALVTLPAHSTGTTPSGMNLMVSGRMHVRGEIKCGKTGMEKWCGKMGVVVAKWTRLLRPLPSSALNAQACRPMMAAGVVIAQ